MPYGLNSPAEPPLIFLGGDLRRCTASAREPPHCAPKPRDSGHFSFPRARDQPQQPAREPLFWRSNRIRCADRPELPRLRSEEHTSELQSRFDLVCRLLLEKKK